MRSSPLPEDEECQTKCCSRGACIAVAVVRLCKLTGFVGIELVLCEFYVGTVEVVVRRVRSRTQCTRRSSDFGFGLLS